MQPPIIDIAGLVEGAAAALERVAAELREPAAEWGVFHVVGHGISKSELAAFESVMREFFALSAGEKAALRRSEGNAWGYYDEELTKNQPDWKEVFDYGADRTGPALEHSDGVNRWPADPPHFRRVLLDHFEACERVGLGLLRALCLSLGLAPNALDGFFGDHSSFVRLNHYAPCPEPADPDAPLFPDSGHLGVHHHTDAGALTLLYQDDVAGLQAWLGDAFVIIEPVAGALTVNLADMLQVWSNDRYRSPVHRVLTSADRSRYSAPFFLNPAYETVCAPIPNLLGPDEPARYRPIQWHEFRGQRSRGDYANYGHEIQIADFRIERADGA